MTELTFTSVDRWTEEEKGSIQYEANKMFLAIPKFKGVNLHVVYRDRRDAADLTIEGSFTPEMETEITDIIQSVIAKHKHEK